MASDLDDSQWSFPAPTRGEDLVGVGADLAPTTLLNAYRQGLFPMRVAKNGPLGWWSPDPRAILPLANFRRGRSWRRAERRFQLSVNNAFEAVMRGCADPRRPHGWIDEEFIAAYGRLHEMGFAHSIEVWSSTEVHPNQLVGGIYGVALGGLFAGESMFSLVTDASKVALAGLVDRLRAGGGKLLDVQWLTPHLASLGVIEIARTDYLALLAEAVDNPQLQLAD